MSDRSMDALADYLPPDCRDILYGVAAGMTLDAAIDEMLGKALQGRGRRTPRRASAGYPRRFG